jgi:hypothetical protein
MIADRSGSLVVIFFGLDGGCASQAFISAMGEPLEPLCLGQQDSPEAALHFSFRNDLGEAGAD